MFCPAASPVVKLNRRNRNLLAENCSMSRSLPVRVVASASRAMAVEVGRDPLAERAGLPRALSNPNAGARCMTSSITVVVTPPAWCSSFMPRL